MKFSNYESTFYRFPSWLCHFSKNTINRAIWRNLYFKGEHDSRAGKGEEAGIDSPGNM